MVILSAYFALLIFTNFQKYFTYKDSIDDSKKPKLDLALIVTLLGTLVFIIVNLSFLSSAYLGVGWLFAFLLIFIGRLVLKSALISSEEERAAWQKKLGKVAIALLLLGLLILIINIYTTPSPGP